MEKFPEQNDFSNGLKKESRYKPGEYRVEIPVEAAREDIEQAVPDFEVKEIEYLSEGIGSTVFIVNGDFIFRFAKNDKADASIKKEAAVLPHIEESIDVSIPHFEYTGEQGNGLQLVGYRKIEGNKLEKSDLTSKEGRVDSEITQQIATFFNQLHSIDTSEAKQWGLKEQNFRSQYENELEDARDHLFNLLEQTFPKEAGQIKSYIDELFNKYLNNENNFNYKPAVLHGDLEAEHIVFDRSSQEIKGVIDWGGVRIGDPDYDLFRPYSHYGREFIEEFLKYYPHPNPEQLLDKLDFFFRAQMIHRTVRATMLGDNKSTEWNLKRLKKQALGEGYWYSEFKEERI